jgi:RND family efflux transporter MFP subunit
VRAGDVIARLDPQDLKLQVESAEAELAAATSNLAQAAADLKRYTTLKERGYAAIADFDRKTAANDEAEGRLARARRALDLARNQLAYAELKADADGVITATLAEPGQVVAVGQPVARLAHRGEKEAVVALPETWLDAVRGAKASVRLWSDRSRSFAARLRELSPQADPATRTYAARFTILQADDTVAFGMTATVTLERAREDAVARLPLSAVLNRGTGPSVYVVDATGALMLRPVTVAAFTEDAALVVSGVSNGDKVVTLGVQKLEAGRRVRAVETTQ